MSSRICTISFTILLNAPPGGGAAGAAMALLASATKRARHAPATLLRTLCIHPPCSGHRPALGGRPHLTSDTGRDFLTQIFRPRRRARSDAAEGLSGTFESVAPAPAWRSSVPALGADAPARAARSASSLRNRTARGFRGRRLPHRSFDPGPA